MWRCDRCRVGPGDPAVVVVGAGSFSADTAAIDPSFSPTGASASSCFTMKFQRKDDADSGMMVPGGTDECEGTTEVMAAALFSTALFPVVFTSPVKVVIVGVQACAVTKSARAVGSVFFMQIFFSVRFAGWRVSSKFEVLRRKQNICSKISL